jgi:hypothetical protein
MGSGHASDWHRVSRKPCPQRFPMTGGQPYVPAVSALYGRFGSGDGAHVSLVTYNQVRCGSKRG